MRHSCHRIPARNRASVRALTATIAWSVTVCLLLHTQAQAASAVRVSKTTSKLGSTGGTWKRLDSDFDGVKDLYVAPQWPPGGPPNLNLKYACVLH
jgi:hypothetical protein